MTSVSETFDRRCGFDRRAGVDRRDADRRDQVVARALGPRTSTVVDQRQEERRRSERRAIVPGTGTTAVSATAGEPQLVCPVCQGALEYEVMLSWMSPAAYTVDTGYCPSCSRRFLRTRHTGRYDSFSWAPLCRVCREPVTSVRLHQDRRTVYRCPMHPDAVWEYDTVTNGWALRT